MSKIATDLSCVTTVSVDLAKHVFQVHAVDAGGKVIVAKALPVFCSILVTRAITPLLPRKV
jgi:transposase